MNLNLLYLLTTAFLPKLANIEARSGVVVVPIDFSAVTRANNEFTIDLLRQTVQSSSEKSIIISPFNVANVLAMVLLGAKGRTRDEMATALRITKEGQLTDAQSMYINTQLSQMYQNLSDRPVNITLELSNGLYPAQGFTLNPSYTKSIDAFYKATVKNLNYAVNAEGSRKQINDQVSKSTHGKIKELIPSGVLSAATRLVLTSAIFFKGDWHLPFNEKLTKSQKFHIISGKTVQIPFMSKRESDAHFWEGSQPNMGPIKVLRLDYKNQDFAFYALLPESGKLNEMIRTGLTAETFREIASKFGKYKKRVDNIALPKFKISTDVAEMKEILQKLGMKQAFGPQADLSGLTASKHEGMLSIDDVFHQAIIEVNEQGSVASAASGAAILEYAVLKPVEFIADRPFLYYIAERKSGTILFIGTFTGVGHQ